jgi:hypothetical protein
MKCTCNPRKHGEFFDRGRFICIYCRKEVVDPSDLEAQAIAQARTIAEQSVVIREHVAVEAIRAQAEEIKRLKEVVNRLNRD